MKKLLVGTLVALSLLLGYNAYSKEDGVTHYLALYFKSLELQQPPEIIAPFMSAEKCEKARQDIIELNKEDIAKFNGDARFVCLKIVNGSEV